MSNLKSGPIAWMASHHVAANLLMVICLLGGYIFMKDMKQEVFPEFSVDVVQIQVAYPGASPQEIETGIILAIEEAVSGLEGIDFMRSRASEGAAFVNLNALTDIDINKFAQDIQKEVDRIITFPNGAETPSITILSTKRRVVSVAMYGNTSTANLHHLAENLRETFLANEHITQVEITGVPPLEISIEVSQKELRRYNISLNDIAEKLRATSIDLPSGSIKTSGGEILIRMTERREFGKEFGQITVLSDTDGSEVKLADIATIKDAYEDNDYHALYNNKAAVMLDVFRIGDETPTQISKVVHTILAAHEATLPEEIKISILSDRSKIFEQRLDLLLKNSALGLILVLIFLALFLNLKLAFWVMMGIPISFLGSFLILPHLGVSINMISMFAFIIALGIVVDDAIVIGENIYHHRQQGMSPVDAAITGAKEMATPVTFSILTNIVTFLPLAFIPGFMGNIFIVIPVVVISVFLISLLESLFILPGHLNSAKEKDKTKAGHWFHQKQQKFSKGFVRSIDTYFMPALAVVLKFRYLSFIVAIAILVITLSYALSGRMGLTLFPKVESDFSRATILLPYGTHINNTESIVRYAYDKAKEAAGERHNELIKGIFASVGKGGTQNATVYVYLAEPEVREQIMSTDEFTNRWRKAIGNVAGVESILFEADAGGPGSGKALTIELNHRDLSVLEKASAELADALRLYPKVKDVYDGFSPGKQQLDFTINALGKSLGLTPQSIASQVRNAYQGLEVLRQLRGRNELKVKVRLPKSERVSEYSLDELIIQTPQGNEVPLRDVVIIERGRAFTEINRRDGRRVVEVSAEHSPRSEASAVITDLQIATLPNLLKKYPGLQYSLEGSRAEMRKSLGSLIPMFGIAMVAIYMLLAIPFRSYSQPLIILISIPFGIIGAIWGHLIMGYSLSIVSMLGVVALSGIVVNDSLILINYANQLRIKTTASALEVISLAAKQRFRPILITTLTTFGGLFPMILETSRQAKFLIPMALSIGFGLLFATVIILFIVPALYVIFDDIRKFFGSLFNSEKRA